MTASLKDLARPLVLTLVCWSLAALVRAQATSPPAEADDETGLAAVEARLYATEGRVVFANGRDARDIPFELASDKIYLRVRLNGQGPFWMYLDTGAGGMALDTATARRLALPLGESAVTTGAGERDFLLTEVKATVDAELPGVRLEAQPAVVGPLDEIVGPYEGRHLEGLLGCHSLMTRFVVIVDYGRRLLHLIPPEDFEPGEDGRVVPIVLEYGHPFVDATLRPRTGEPITGRFLVDTGLRRAMLLTAPFVDRHDLVRRSAPTVYTTTGGGIGGQVFAHVGRMRSVTFGEITIEDFPASLSQASAGLVATEFAAGIIGSSVLQRFRVAFDYTRERLVVWERNYDADDLDYDKSGLFLVADVEDRSRLRVLDVVAGSPAAEAGIEVGDRLTAVAGKPLSELPLERVRRLLRGPAGNEVELTFERGGEAVRVVVRLRRVV